MTSDFIKITEPDGSEYILNKGYIISVEKNSKGCSFECGHSKSIAVKDA
jgi:hypothetical protein